MSLEAMLALVISALNKEEHIESAYVAEVTSERITLAVTDTDGKHWEVDVREG